MLDGINWAITARELGEILWYCVCFYHKLELPTTIETVDLVKALVPESPA